MLKILTDICFYLVGVVTCQIHFISCLKFYQLNTMHSPHIGVVNSRVQLSNFEVTDFEETLVLVL